MKRTVLALLLLLACPTPSQAQSLDPTVLLWEYPDLPVDRFLLSRFDTTGSSVDLTVAPSAQGACGQGTATGWRTFCAQLPECLPPGTWAFLVVAIQGAQTSPPSDPLVCTVDAARPCLCAESPAPASPSPPTPPGPPLAGPDLLPKALAVSAPPVVMPPGGA